MENAVENKKIRTIKTEEERIRELNAEIKRIRKMQEQKSRKLETRQKILIGGAMLSLMKNMDESKRLDLIRCLKAKMAEKDKCIAFPDIHPPQMAVTVTPETVEQAISEEK